MNKNWFYRVLALALVAMLAVPMFAFAEEDVLATAAEAPAEELATALEGEDEIEPKVVFSADDLIDVMLGVKVPMYGGLYDLSTSPIVQLNLTNSNGKKESFKSSNKKVATVSATGAVFFVGAGTATITCSGYVDGFKKKLTSKIVFDVIDLTEPTWMAGYMFGEEGPFTDSGETVFPDGSELTVYPGMGIAENDVPTLHYQPLPFNDAHEYLGLDYKHGYHFKWSNAKVAFFDGNLHLGFQAAEAPETYGAMVDETTGLRIASPVNLPFVSAAKFWMGEFLNTAGEQVLPDNDLMPIFYKPGKSTLTIKTMATAGMKSKSYTNKWIVDDQKITLSMGTDSELQKKANRYGAVLFQPHTLDIQSMDKVVLTLKVYNGTAWQIPMQNVTFKAGFEENPDFLQYRMNEYPADSGIYPCNNAVKGVIKPNKTSTITITFQNKRDAAFNIKSCLGGENTVFSRKDVQEIYAPYMNVWRDEFVISEFTMRTSPAFGGITITPVYAFVPGVISPIYGGEGE